MSKKKKIFTTLFFVAIGILGLIGGIMMGMRADGAIAPEKLFANSTVQQSICYVLLGVFFIVNLAEIILCPICVKKAQHLVEKAENSDDENSYEIADRFINKTSTIFQMLFVISCIMSLTVEMLSANLGILEQNEYLSPIIAIVFLTALIIGTKSIQKLFNINKQLNPNIDLNIFDLTIMSTQEKQSDEAQKLLLYKCTYKSFEIISNILQVALLVMFLITMIFDLSPLPFITLGLVVIFITITYCVVSYKVMYKNK